MNWISLLCIAGLVIFGFLWKRASSTDVQYANALVGAPASAKSAWAMLWILCFMILVGQFVFSSKEKSNIDKLSQMIPLYPNAAYNSRLPFARDTEHLMYDTDDPPKTVIDYYLNSTELGEWLVKSKLENMGVLLTKGTKRELTIMVTEATGWTPKKPYQITYILKRPDK